MNYKVLFIDDDAFMLKALLRTAKRIRPSWTFFGCEQASNWLTLVSEVGSPDIIICDYQMPEINGEQVLLQAMAHCPAAVRVLLTGDTSEHIVTRACRFSHHIVGKPFTEDNLLEVLQCVERLQRLPLSAASRTQLGQLQELPVLPALVQQLKALLQAPDAELVQVATLIQHEPALAAKLVQLANSAFMGFTRPVSNILEAVLRLGSKLVEAIVTMHSIDKQFSDKLPPAEHLHITQVAFEHALYAKKLASYAGLTSAEQDTVFSAAIFGAIGGLIEAAALPDAGQALSPPPLMQTGFSNSTLISVYMLTLWGHAEALCNVLLWQDTPSPQGNAIEQLSFILFLAKQLVIPMQQADLPRLQEIIDSEQLLAAFNRLLAERT